MINNAAKPLEQSELIKRYNRKMRRLNKKYEDFMLETVKGDLRE